MLSAQRISVRMGSKTLLDQVSLRVLPSELLAVIGPNGAGKSTLLKALCGELALAQGEVSMNGRRLRNWSPRERARQRAVLPQDCQLSFPLTVLDVVLMGRSPYFVRVEHAHDKAIAHAALQRVDAERLAQRSYPTLSGGERQRVQLARVLAQIWEPHDRLGPRYLLLDEPTAALDLAHQHTALAIAQRFAKDQGAGVITILHDLNLASLYADRIAILSQGRLWAEGTPQQVITASGIAEVFGLPVSIIGHPEQPERPLIVASLSGRTHICRRLSVCADSLDRVDAAVDQ